MVSHGARFETQVSLLATSRILFLLLSTSFPGSLSTALSLGYTSVRSIEYQHLIKADRGLSSLTKLVEFKLVV